MRKPNIKVKRNQKTSFIEIQIENDPAWHLRELNNQGGFLLMTPNSLQPIYVVNSINEAVERINEWNSVEVTYG